MADAKEEKPLKPEWKIFAEQYVIDWNGTRAYQIAYPDASYDTARANQSKLLANTCIDSYIEDIQKDLAKLAGVSALSNVNYLTEILEAEGEEKEATKDRINALKVMNDMLGYNAPVKKDIRLETDRKETSDLFPSDEEFDETKD